MTTFPLSLPPVCLASIPDAAAYYFWNNLGTWLLLATVCWLLGLFIGWLLWHRCRREAEKIEAENRIAREQTDQPHRNASH